MSGPERGGWLRAWGPAAAWAALILVLTSVPLPGAAPGAPGGADKAAHLFLYGVLGWQVMRGAQRAGGSRRNVLVAVAAAMLFAALDEWHQGWLPRREPEMMDWVADVVGLFLGAGARRLWPGRRPGERGESLEPEEGPSIPEER